MTQMNIQPVNSEVLLDETSLYPVKLSNFIGMKNLQSRSWDEYFMSLAFFVAMKSKDRSSQVGCVIVGNENQILSTGYNGFPRGFDDNVKEYHDRPLKYAVTEHAERNSIYNATRSNIPINGARLYVLDVPCSDCARAIIQSGISEVIHYGWWTKNGDAKRWAESMKISMQMFNETGVLVRKYRGPLVTKLTNRYDGKMIDV